MMEEGQRANVGSHEDAFGLLAELAIALVGFTGVAAAFAGRERSYRATERIRLNSLFMSGGMVVAGSGGVYTLLLAGVSSTASYRLVSLFAAAFFTACLPWLARAYRSAREPESTSEPWALYLATADAIVVLGLLGSNVYVGAAHLLAGAFWIQLVYGLWMFSRLLTRPN